MRQKVTYAWAVAEAIAAQVPDESSVSVEQVEVPRPDGSTLSIRLLRPTAEAGPLPVLLWFHGGGQVLKIRVHACSRRG
ncbi:hypothetical protein [Streptomyces sp. Root369]|uniref:hypothetical protein n=1 Tax=Streptomyces sp. Root369 TaxID=1736523 RepID=UPI00070BDE07|nr:hypothetical protein [Streptomyces sp. Root369]KQW07338.1 hypothetical protein ASD08_07160 [Streptomyces sp. Root369]